MKNAILGIVASVALVSAAQAETKKSYETTTKGQSDSDGNYKTDTTAETTDAAGTTRKTETNEKGSVHSDGTKKMTKDSSVSTDPKGLMNKSSGEKKVYGKSDQKGNYTGQVKNDSVDAQGRAFKEQKDVNRKVRSDGTVETTATKEVSDDPRGLLNRSTGEVKTKTLKHPDGTVSSKTTKKVDGTTVEETKQ